MERYLELENGMKLFVVSKLQYNNKTYYFSVTTTDETEYLFIEQVDDNKISIVEDGRTIAELYKIILEYVQDLLKDAQEN